MSVEIVIKKSTRARRVRLSISSAGAVTVTQPVFASDAFVRDFVESKRSWIEHHVLRMQNRNLLQIPKASKKDFEKHKREAKFLVLEKLRVFNTHYKSTFNRVTIKNTKSRWGSCSKHKNLNFNYRIIFLPEHLQDYLVVHELCHTKVFNHGRDFWALVEETIPRAVIREFKTQVV